MNRESESHIQPYPCSDKQNSAGRLVHVHSNCSNDDVGHASASYSPPHTSDIAFLSQVKCPFCCEGFSNLTLQIMTPVGLWSPFAVLITGVIAHSFVTVFHTAEAPWEKAACHCSSSHTQQDTKCKINSRCSVNSARMNTSLKQPFPEYLSSLSR